MIALFLLMQKIKNSLEWKNVNEISMIKPKLYDPFVLLVFLFYAQAKPLGIGVKVAHLHI